MDKINETKEHENVILLEYLKHDYPIWHFIRQKRVAQTVSMMNGKLVLNVGCGIGLLDFLLTDKTLVGVDVNSEYVKEARRIERTIKPGGNMDYFFVVADLEFLPFKKEFDIVISSQVLEHLKDDRKALKTISTFIKYNGILLITIPNTRRFKVRARVLRLITVGRMKRFMYPEHIREYSVGDIPSLLESLPLKIDDINGIYLVFPLIDFLNELSRIFNKVHFSTAIGLAIYQTSYKLYTSLWLKLERIFWHHAVYLMVSFKKTLRCMR